MAPSKDNKKSTPSKRSPSDRITLRDLADHLNLSPTTVSLVLNRSPNARSIPTTTQERVFAAADELRYRPHHLARSLRSRRTMTVGVLVPEIFEPYAAGIMSGIESYLAREGYLYIVASHQSSEEGLEGYLDLLKSRMVEGVILLAANLRESPGIPAVAVSNHEELDGVTNVVIDHEEATRLALTHLMEFGHQRIAFFRGQPSNADTEDRWAWIGRTAAALDLEVHEELTLELADDPTRRLTRTEEAYREGYDYGRQLLDNGHEFTALFAFNDVSAIGAMRAFLDAGKRVPEDISVVGFDDILSARFHNPGLTTVRQPLREMGVTAGKRLLERLRSQDDRPDSVTIEPELVVRESTGPASRT